MAQDATEKEIAMCFKPPKPKPVAPNPELALQKSDSEAIAQERRSEAKKMRINETIAKMSGYTGRSSLFSGGAGGAGFAAPAARSLFVTI